MRFQTFAALLLLIVLAAGWLALDGREAPDHATASVRPSEAELSCDVAYVHDGDSLRCQDGARIRLHAVAARETDETCSPGHPCPAASGAAATASGEGRKLCQAF